MSAIVFIYFILFATTLVTAITFTYKRATEAFEIMQKPMKKSSIHPEMEDVASGTELLVFRAEAEDDDDSEGDVLIVRK